MNPHGLMYHEVTASSLVKVDMQGNVVEKGTTNFGVNSLGFRLHAALHAARPDIKCVIHVRSPPVLAVRFCHSLYFVYYVDNSWGILSLSKINCCESSGE